MITEENKNFYDDVTDELAYLIEQRPPAELRQANHRAYFQPASALNAIHRSLGCANYPSRSSSRVVNLEAIEHPYYASLGSVDAFADELVSWAYDRQRRCDPRNKPYYLDCLKDIAEGRNSSDLQTKVVEAMSLGEVGQEEIESAYAFFNLDPNNTEEDDHIIGVYNVRIEASPRQKEEARKVLKVIAGARNSEKIMTVANEISMSYEDALDFLEIEAATESEFVETMYSLKVCKV